MAIYGVKIATINFHPGGVLHPLAFLAADGR
jgi:hypothetical protein